MVTWLGSHASCSVLEECSFGSALCNPIVCNLTAAGLGVMAVTIRDQNGDDKVRAV